MGSNLIAMVKPQEYFKDRVSTAADTLQVGLDDQLEFYLVNLLCEFISPERAANGEPVDILDTPLALMLKRAMEASPDERFRILKRLGDTSLYFAGFFQDYFNRKTFDITYYISMGTSAYQNISALVRQRHGGDQFSEMYRELADEFETLVEIVAQVSDDQPIQKDVNILATYDRWTKTNSERLRKILVKQGIAPVPSNTKTKQ